jgi:hypothetical protein
LEVIEDGAETEAVEREHRLTKEVEEQVEATGLQDFGAGKTCIRNRWLILEFPFYFGSRLLNS